MTRYKFPSAMQTRNAIDQDSLMIQRVEDSHIAFTVTEEDTGDIIGQATLTQEQAHALAMKVCEVLGIETDFWESYLSGYDRGHADGAIETEEAAYESGFDDGQQDGYEDGHDDGYDAGYGDAWEAIEEDDEEEVA